MLESERSNRCWKDRRKDRGRIREVRQRVGRGIDSATDAGMIGERSVKDRGSKKKGREWDR